MQKYKAYEYTGDTLIYDPGEVEAELARLKAEIQRFCDVDTENQALECAADTDSAEIARLKDDLQASRNANRLINEQATEDIDLLKAALRWCVLRGAFKNCDKSGIEYISDVLGRADIPPEFAAVIAEALEKSDD